MQSYIGRTSTGKYHMAYSPSVTVCNHSGQRRSTFNRPANEGEIAFAKKHPEAVCQRCFNQGIPEGWEND